MTAVNDPSNLVGRDAELTRIFDAMRAARTGAGSTVFIAGDLGAGKQALLDAAYTQARADADLAEMFVARGVCTREGNSGNPYEPFANIVVALVEESRASKGFSAILKAIKDVAPDWLGMVPIAGPAVQAGVKTALRAQELYAGDAAEERTRRAQSLYEQFVAALDARLRRSPMVVLEVSQAQWIDGASASLLGRLAGAAAQRPVLVLVSYRPSDVGAGHALRDVERDLRIDRLGSTLPLAGLDAGAVSEFVRRSRGMGLSSAAADWLVAYTAGNPLFMTELVPVLIDDGILVSDGATLSFSKAAVLKGDDVRLVGELSHTTIPERVSDVLDERIDRLDDIMREQLEIAAVEGPQFLNATVALVAKADDRKILQQLRDAEERYQMVRYSEALQHSLFRYEFAHLLLHQRLYARLSPPLRLEYHWEIAEALVQTWGEHAPRSVLLEIARHYEEGNDRPAAARFLVGAAESALLDGAATEAAAIAERALALLAADARSPRPVVTDALKAQLVAVLVSARWENLETRPSGVGELLAQGKAAAERARDPALRARLEHAEARVELATGNVAAVIDALGRARELAQEADDPVSELAVNIDLGNTLGVQDLDAGLAVLHESLALYDARLSAQAADSAEIGRLHGLLLAFTGIGEFDHGDLGTALHLLDESIAGLEAIGRRADFPRILNYRAQAWLAAGDFEAAEADAHAAIDAGSDAGSPWDSYNTALLGKICIDAGRFDDARRWLESAWAAVTDRWQIRLGTAVRQYRIELLLRAGSSAEEVDAAEPLLADQQRESAEAGFHNMLLGARSLAAELALRRGEPASAQAESAAAVQMLEVHGSVAIVRTEEVLWRHARCLDAAGLAGGDAFRDRARDIVERKAASLGDQAARRRMLERTPVARALRSEAGGHASDWGGWTLT